MQVQIGNFGVVSDASVTCVAATAKQLLPTTTNCNEVWLTNLTGNDLFIGLGNTVTNAIYNIKLAAGAFQPITCSGTFAQNLWAYSVGGGDVRVAVLN